MYYRDRADGTVSLTVYRYLSDAVRYSAHPGYKLRPPVRSRSVWQDGFSVLPHPKVFLSHEPVSDNPVLHLPGSQAEHGFPLIPVLRSVSGTSKVPVHS